MVSLFATTCVRVRARVRACVRVCVLTIGATLHLDTGVRRTVSLRMPFVACLPFRHAHAQLSPMAVSSAPLQSIPHRVTVRFHYCRVQTPDLAGATHCSEQQTGNQSPGPDPGAGSPVAALRACSGGSRRSPTHVPTKPESRRWDSRCVLRSACGVIAGMCVAGSVRRCTYIA